MYSQMAKLILGPNDLDSDLLKFSSIKGHRKTFTQVVQHKFGALLINREVPNSWKNTIPRSGFSFTLWFAQ